MTRGEMMFEIDETATTPEPVKTPRGLRYHGDVGRFSVYNFWLRGRVVLEVTVDNDDEALPIYVGRPGAVEASFNGDNEALRPTNGRAQLATYVVPGPGVDAPPEGVAQHVDSWTVRSYVKPRLAVLLAKAFVPEAVQPTE
jgi:hypothetical protein